MGQRKPYTYHSRTIGCTMTSTSDVREAFESVDGAEVHYFTGSERAVVEVPESSIGHAFGALRRAGLEYSAKRHGDSLLATISVSERSLGDLF